MRSKIVFTEPSMTVQSEADYTDINKIVERARVTGVYSHTQRKPPLYIDCTTVGGYQASLERVNAVETAFGRLPAHVRARFQNSPVEMIKFLADKNNVQEAISLGLMEPKSETKKADATPPPPSEK